MEYRREYPRCQESCQLAPEFGYAIGASRPLALKASAQRCSFCPENFIAGIELYGGLGDRHSFGLHDTSQYLARVIAWNLPSDWTPRLSPGLGLNDNSYRFLLRLPRILRVRLSHKPSIRRTAMMLRISAILLLLTQGAVTAQTNSVPGRKGSSVYAELAKAPKKAAARHKPLEHDPDAVAAGGKLFALHCAECHGEMAEGGRKAPSLLAEQVPQATPDTLFWILTNGVVRHGIACVVQVAH